MRNRVWAAVGVFAAIAMICATVLIIDSWKARMAADLVEVDPAECREVIEAAIESQKELNKAVLELKAELARHGKELGDE